MLQRTPDRRRAERGLVETGRDGDPKGLSARPVFVEPYVLNRHRVPRSPVNSGTRKPSQTGQPAMQPWFIPMFYLADSVRRQMI
jgi:hypothetical protein